jgi:tRNA nucleotidyltransferase (CCA-adding enzyme)
MAIGPEVIALARAIAAAGGRALMVGGSVRDRLLGIESKDFDLEVYGLPAERLEEVLRGFGEVIAVGRAFGVLRVKGIDGDISLPRRDSKTGRGHRGFLVEMDPAMDFTEASRRRDLTMNAMGLDPLTGEVLDPHSGRRDLERKVLRAVDPRTFPEDSLRGLRVAQFAARFQMAPDPELHRLAAALDLSDLPGERMFDEFAKLLLQGVRPSLGLEFLRATDLLRFFPELKSMVGVPQDPEWHPEGTVWEHTLLVVDEAAALRTGRREEDLALMFGALCHDLGKPPTTVREGGRIRSPNHEEEGVPLAQAFLERLRAPGALTQRVALLVRHHLAPSSFIRQAASPRAYRRLARKLGEGGLNMGDLERLARSDHFGRTTPEALARRFPEGEEFLRRARDLEVEAHAIKDVVLGRHLIARGMEPGPHFGPLLARCRAIQEETGLTDPQLILDRALSGEEPPGGADTA